MYEAIRLVSCRVSRLLSAPLDLVLLRLPDAERHENVINMFSAELIKYSEDISDRPLIPQVLQH